MEELVVKPLEKEIWGLENIKRIRTSIGDGVAALRVEYKYNSNVDNKYQEIVRVVNSKRSGTAAGYCEHRRKKIPALRCKYHPDRAVSENASREKMKYYAEKLQDELEKLPALKKVEIHGIPEPQVRVELDLEKMTQMHLPLSAVTGSLQSEIANIPGGSIAAGQTKFQYQNQRKFPVHRRNKKYHRFLFFRKKHLPERHGKNLLRF